LKIDIFAFVNAENDHFCAISTVSIYCEVIEIWGLIYQMSYDLS